MDLHLNGKSAIVTGASRGLGRATALALAQEGMSPFLVARDVKALEETARLIAAAGGRAAGIHACDLSDRGAPEDAVRAGVEALGGIDLLVNCAGATKRGDFFSLTDADFHDGFELKFHGTVRMCRAAWPHLAARGGGIVNIVGVGASTPSADFTIGGSVNAALLNFTKAIAEIGTRAGVRVNAVSPGHIRTDRLEHRLQAAAAQTGAAPGEIETAMLERLRISRFGEPIEIGRLVAFLASDQSAYIHGATLNIDDGATKGI